MKHYRIALQEGLDDLKKLLIASGFEVLPPGRELQAEITIIAYGDEEETEDPSPARISYKDQEKKSRVLIDASHLTPEQVLELITMDLKKNVH